MLNLTVAFFPAHYTDGFMHECIGCMPAALLNGENDFDHVFDMKEKKVIELQITFQIGGKDMIFSWLETLVNHSFERSHSFKKDVATKVGDFGEWHSCCSKHQSVHDFIEDKPPKNANASETQILDERKQLLMARMFNFSWVVLEDLAKRFDDKNPHREKHYPSDGKTFWRRHDLTHELGFCMGNMGQCYMELESLHIQMREMKLLNDMSAPIPASVSKHFDEHKKRWELLQKRATFLFTQFIIVTKRLDYVQNMDVVTDFTAHMDRFAPPRHLLWRIADDHRLLNEEFKHSRPFMCCCKACHPASLPSPCVL